MPSPRPDRHQLLEIFRPRSVATAPGDRGALTLYGTKRTNHAIFAQHVAGSEISALTHGHGRNVREWRLKPLRPDNHWLDCLVGCAVAASIQGNRP